RTRATGGQAAGLGSPFRRPGAEGRGGRLRRTGPTGPCEPGTDQSDHESAIVGALSPRAGPVPAANGTRSRPHSDASPAAHHASRGLEGPAAVVGRPGESGMRLIPAAQTSTHSAARQRSRHSARCIVTNVRCGRSLGGAQSELSIVATCIVPLTAGENALL